MVLLIIIPFLNGYFIGNIPYFQTNPFFGHDSTFFEGRRVFHCRIRLPERSRIVIVWYNVTTRNPESAVLGMTAKHTSDPVAFWGWVELGQSHWSSVGSLDRGNPWKKVSAKTLQYPPASTLLLDKYNLAFSVPMMLVQIRLNRHRLKPSG